MAPTQRGIKKLRKSTVILALGHTVGTIAYAYVTGAANGNRTRFLTESLGLAYVLLARAIVSALVVPVAVTIWCKRLVVTPIFEDAAGFWVHVVLGMHAVGMALGVLACFGLVGNASGLEKGPSESRTFLTMAAIVLGLDLSFAGIVMTRARQELQMHKLDQHTGGASRARGLDDFDDIDSMETADEDEESEQRQRRARKAAAAAASSRQRPKSNGKYGMDNSGEHKSYAPSATEAKIQQARTEAQVQAMAQMPAVLPEVMVPKDFESMWAGAQRAGTFTTAVQAAPSMDELNAHLARVGFRTAASGVVAGVSRIFFYGQEGAVFFLARVEVRVEVPAEQAGEVIVGAVPLSSTTSTVDAEFRCVEGSGAPVSEGVVGGFVARLQLQAVFGRAN